MIFRFGGKMFEKSFICFGSFWILSGFFDAGTRRLQEACFWNVRGTFSCGFVSACNPDLTWCNQDLTWLNPNRIWCNPHLSVFLSKSMGFRGEDVTYFTLVMVSLAPSALICRDESFSNTAKMPDSSFVVIRLRHFVTSC